MSQNYGKNITIAIPARYSSQRFPGKMIASIAGIPLIVRVYQSLAKNFYGEIVVLPDDERVVQVLKEYSIPYIQTSPSCRSGTHRIASVVDKLKGDFIVNVQGDEPLITTDLVRHLADLLMNSEADIATLARSSSSRENAQNPNIVKVVTTKDNWALYFSRSMIPYPREKFQKWKLHVGIYGYRRNFLEHFDQISLSDLEIAEKLEQLSFLYEGKKIIVGETDVELHGVDVPEDVKKIEHILKKQGML